MAGTIPLSMTQQFDEFGEPLSGGLLYIYQAGTVATPQNPYQDYGLSILHPNPIPLDAAGRIPQFFVADGFLKFRLTNSAGVAQLAQDNVLVIGPSSGGGGGGSVDPTTVLQTGMVSIFYGTGIVAGFVRANARTIGSATSGGTERANADTNALFQFLWNADANLSVSGGRGASSAADWAANKTIAMPDARGCTIGGLDDMGNTPAGRLTATYFGTSAIVLGARGGAESNTLTAAQSGVVAHDHNVYLKDNQHTHTNTNPPFYSGNVGGSGVAGGSGAGLATPTISTNSSNITIGSVNGTANDNKTAQVAGAPASAAHANVQPTLLATIYLKL